MSLLHSDDYRGNVFMPMRVSQKFILFFLSFKLKVSLGSKPGIY